MTPIEEIIVPLTSVNDTSVLVVKIKFNNRDFVPEGSILAELETSKTTVDVVSKVSGYIEVLCREGEEVPVNHCIFKIYSDQSYSSDSDVKVFSNSIKPISKDENLKVHKTKFTKSALEYINQNNLELEYFNSFDYVSIQTIKKIFSSKPDPKGIPVKTKNVIKTENDEFVNLERISRDKKLEIEFLNSVQNSNLVSNVSMAIQADRVLPFLNTRLQVIKDSLLPLIILESSRLLRKYPLLNSYFADDIIATYKFVNIGFAVDMDKGLKVLTIPNSDTINLLEIEKSILDLSQKYIDENLGIGDLANSTFTITDLSGYGVDDFYPLINKANSAILGISAMDGSGRVKVTISFDHRCMTGKYVSIFLSELKQRIEEFSFSGSIIKRRRNIRCYKCFREVDQNLKENVTFLKVIDNDGNDNILCSLCFEGY